jgi:hypothetical protein
MISIEDHADGDVLEIVRDGMRGTGPHTPLGDVVRRGRQLRRRRTARRGVTAVASAAALVTGAVVATGLPGAGQHLTASGRRVDVDLAGWSVHTGAHSTVTLTLRESELRDPARLRAVLAEAGVAADIEVVPAKWTRDGVWTTVYGCQADPRRVALPQGADVLGGWHSAADGATSMTIDPTRMPPGSVVGFVFYTFAESPPGLHLPVSSPAPGWMALFQGTPPPCVVTTPDESSRAQVWWKMTRTPRTGTVTPSPR